MQDLLSQINKRFKNSKRFITCQICGKTITKKQMAKHFLSFHLES